MRELPFVVGVMGNFSGHSGSPFPALSERDFFEVDGDNFDHFLARLKPSLNLWVVNHLVSGGNALELKLAFTSLNDFSPEHLAQRIGPLRALMLEQDLPESSTDPGDEANPFLQKQLNDVLHDSEFQKLEASWRGLHYLVSHSETGPMLKICVLNVSKQELQEDLMKDSLAGSAIYTKLNGAFGRFGAAPFSVLIGDYEFTHELPDVRLLERIAEVASSIHAPFIAAAAPPMFGVREFMELSEIRDVGKIFDQTEYDAWRAFRESENSRYVGLCLPRALMRSPYDERTELNGTTRFKEDTDIADHQKFLWGNAAYLYASCLTRAFALYHWCAAIRGVEGGGLIDDLPTRTIRVDNSYYFECSLDWLISDRREWELSKLGYLCLIACEGTPKAAFFTASSYHKPAIFDAPKFSAQASLSAQFWVLLVLSRFAHYLKVMMRDKTGSFMSHEDCELFLNQWISSYVAPDDNTVSATRAIFPLRDARIDVTEYNSNSGVYRANVCLRPCIPIDLKVDLRILVDLPLTAR